MQKLSLEIKIILGIVATLIIAIVVGTFVQVNERKVNDARTKKALSELWDSLKVNRQERRAEHAIIIANQDTLKLLLRNFMWIMGMFSLGRII